MKNPKHNHVEKILNYLHEKKGKAENRLKEYIGPVMSAELKNSPHMQVEQTRLATTVELLDDVIMTIEQFCNEALPSSLKPPKRKPTNVKKK